ncbi:MAG: hypothetical protein GEU96_03670 [Propionibacteriales bacterium]|nr:hypothetical protein [Propionibacteriales bacterium]
MSPRSALLVAASLAAWTALLAAALTSRASVLVTLVAGLGALGAWHRRGRVASLAPVVGCVLLLTTGTSALAAAACGVLVLVHVVLVDVADEAHGAAAAPVLNALGVLAPGLALAAGAAVVVATGAVAGDLAAGGVPSTALLLAAPLVLLCAVLVALGLATRRAFWSYLKAPAQVSDVLKRYLRRGNLRA